MEDAHHRETEDISFPIKTILIVEDDQDISLTLEQVLKEETPYQVILVADGFAAQKLLRTVHPNLLVVDYHLPGMDGLELVDSLRAMPKYAHVPILFTSAHPPRSELAQRQLAWLEKPFDLDTFVSRITELLADC